MKITYYGHACFGVEIDGTHLLFDPFITFNELAKSIDINTIPANYIFISHGHQDHLADAASIAQRTGATIVSSWEVVDWFSKQGITKAHPMNTGGKKTFDFGWVKCTVAQHSSSFPDGSYAGNPIGFLVQGGGKTFYYSGDTALTLDMQLIPRWAKLDVALLPIGDNFTMGYEDAAIAADFLQCNRIIGLHYDTFGFIKIDHEAAVKHFSNQGKELILLPIGQGVHI
ncbi:MAG: metal-dependent hydrolase [Chitinophagales bacterium]|nr:metal-dependent hydrolase [Chitinophagales bacterium]MDW8273863.1 metal-dependent hydrolase [Chitinophagales bacterium]